MSSLEAIKEIYRLYLDDKESEERKASALSKLEKLLMSKSSDSKLTAFNEAIQEFVENMIKENPSSQEAAEVVDYMLDAPEQQKNSLIPEIVLVAVIGNALKLIPCINKDEAGGLINKHFSKGFRHITYPNQKAVYKALKNRESSM